MAALYQQDKLPWDSGETGELPLSWQTVLVVLLFALACYGCWRLLVWFMKKSHRTMNWRRARLWWPTAMLGWGWVTLALFLRSEERGTAFDVASSIFAFVNLPALVLAGGLFELLGHMSPRLRVLIGSAILWWTWYLIVRLAEWRAPADAREM